MKGNNVTCIYKATKCRRDLFAWESIDESRVPISGWMTVQFVGRRVEGLNPRSWVGQTIIIDLLRRASIRVRARGGGETGRIILFNSLAFPRISGRVNTTYPPSFIKHDRLWKASRWFIATFLRRGDTSPCTALSGLLINIPRRLFRLLDARWFRA